jgi:hypothetical protein
MLNKFAAIVSNCVQVLVNVQYWNRSHTHTVLTK